MTITDLYREICYSRRGRYQDIIALYETFFYRINELPEEYRVRVFYRYLEALFEQGEYQRVLSQVDALLERAINLERTKVEGDDLFIKSVFFKAAALFNCDRCEESLEVAEQLLSIDRHNKVFVMLYIKSVERRYLPTITKFRAAAVVSFLLSVIIIAAELFVIRPFLVAWIKPTEVARNVLFLLGMVCYAAPHMAARLLAVVKMRKFLVTIRSKRN